MTQGDERFVFWCDFHEQLVSAAHFSNCQFVHHRPQYDGVTLYFSRECAETRWAQYVNEATVKASGELDGLNPEGRKYIVKPPTFQRGQLRGYVS